MSLPASEARALTTIEESLLLPEIPFQVAVHHLHPADGARSDAGLGTARPRRWRPPRGLVIALAFALVVGIIVVGSLGAPPRACGP